MTGTASRMETISSPAELRLRLGEARERGARIGFVPTMGALHDGHLSLIDAARANADLVVMSVFVNPLQFGPAEDYKRYPRDIEADTGLAEERGADVLFTPSTETMYAGAPRVTVTARDIGGRWEGRVRPGHFDGVLTVVSKLFNIVSPDLAVFGQKDLQQAALVRALIEDLDFPIELIVAPIVREADGLAMSSRNRYLSEDDRKRASALSSGLREVADRFNTGVTDARELENLGRAVLIAQDVSEIDYLSVIDQSTFDSVDVARPGSAVIVAARVGSTRLIDNVIL